MYSSLMLLSLLISTTLYISYAQVWLPWYRNIRMVYNIVLAWIIHHVSNVSLVNVSRFSQWLLQPSMMVVVVTVLLQYSFTCNQTFLGPVNSY